jgi:hypothetical protein
LLARDHAPPEETQESARLEKVGGAVPESSQVSSNLSWLAGPVHWDIRILANNGFSAMSSFFTML